MSITGNKGGGKTKSSQQQTSTMTLDPQLQAALYGNLSRATDLANKPYEPYTGEQVAGFNTNQQAAQNNLINLGNSDRGDKSLADATAAATGVASFDARSVMDGFDRYMNPTTDKLVDTTLAGFDENAGRDRAALAAAGAKAGAFGGSRFGVAESVQQGEQERNRAMAEAQLRYDAFDKAAGLSAGDATRSIASAGLRLGGAGQLADLSRQQVTHASDKIGMQGAVGDAQQANMQAQLDAKLEEHRRGQEYPLLMQQLLNQSTGLLPTYGTTNSTGKSKGKTSSWNLGFEWAPKVDPSMLMGA